LALDERVKSTFFNMQTANQLMGKHILVAYTYLKQNGSVDYRKQRHGVITDVDRHNGMKILEAATGETFTLPPDLRSTKPAAEGGISITPDGRKSNRS
jgi:hypothetical protein